MFPYFDRKFGKYAAIWVPATGGIAVGYVFLYQLPKLGAYTTDIANASGGLNEFSDYRAYSFCLAGFILYFLVDSLAESETKSSKRYTILFAAGFIVYALLVGFSIATFSRSSILALQMGSAVLLIHMLGIDHQLRHLESSLFDRYQRWMLAAAVLLGWGGGVVFPIAKEIVMYASAFLSGGIIANVMFEEVPRKRIGRLLPFIIGVALFVCVAVYLRGVPLRNT
jgi:hypothetical protein